MISGGSKGVVAAARSRSRLFAAAFALSTSSGAGMLRLSQDSQNDEGSGEMGSGGSSAFSGPGLAGEEMDDERLEVGYESKAACSMAISPMEIERPGFLDVLHRERLWKRDPNRLAIPEIVESC
jgi:hypothetical protein